MTNDKLWWVLPVPFLIFGAGGWLIFETENEVVVQIARAQLQWREGNHHQAIKLYDAVHENHSRSQFADDALWEIANIYYVSLYDVDRALLYFRKLAKEYPESSLVVDAYLKMAEIQEVELRDLPQTIEYLAQALAHSTSFDSGRQILFKMGNAQLKLNRFVRSLQTFELVVQRAPNDHLSQQARNRIGTIYQITNRYEKSLAYFRATAEKTDCSECRVESYLGLIESYEFLEELKRAIETAESIPDQDFPAEEKQELLRRLRNKLKYYPPPR